MRRSTRGLIGAFAVIGLFAATAAEVSAAPRKAGVRAASGRTVARAPTRRYSRRSNAGPAIAGAALGLIGAATAAAAASQYNDGPYYGGGGYGPGPGYYGNGGYGAGYGGGYGRGFYGY